jgi:hypothetical protein
MIIPYQCFRKPLFKVKQYQTGGGGGGEGGGRGGREEEGEGLFVPSRWKQ